MRRMVIAAVALLCGLSAGRAQAQGVTMTGGYQFMVLLDDGALLPAGWLVSVAGSPNRVVAPVFEAGTAFRPDGDDRFQLWTVQGGARFSIPAGAGRPRAFAQLVGGAIGAGCCREAVVYLMIEPGGGVELPIGSRTSAQIGVGFPFVFTGDGGAHVMRVHAGLSVRLGR